MAILQMIFTEEERLHRYQTASVKETFLKNLKLVSILLNQCALISFTKCSIGQVTEFESLFYYPGESQRKKRQAGGTYDDFQNINFVPIFTDELNFTDEQRVVCEDNLQCLFDLAITEETEFAMTTLEQEKIANATTDTLGNQYT